ncbi:MAG: amidohydrolase family protein [Acidobacteriota bacterium]|nr:amidohydrolase family protein [Acidobacteriota bacterium]
MRLGTRHARGFWSAALLLLLLAVPGAASAAGGTATCSAFVDVTVVPMDQERLLPHRTVLVRGDRIREVAAVGSLAVPGGCAKIDGRERFLIPGLTDSHVHLFGYTRAGAGDRRIESAILMMLLANGVTTAVVMEGTPGIVSLREDVARDRVLGPKLYSAGPLIQMADSGELPWRRTFTTPEEVRQEVVAEKRAGYDFVKVHGDLPEESYRVLLETARQEGLRVVGHVPANLGIDAALSGRQALIVHAESFLDAYFRFHRDLPTDPAEADRMVRDVAARTARAGTWVQPTLSVFRQIVAQISDIDALLERPAMRYLPAAAAVDWQPSSNPYLKHWTLADIPKLRAQYSLMQRLVRGLRDAGVPLLAGTDPMVPSQLPGFSMKDELEQLTAAGLTPFEALQAATASQGRFLGTIADTGTVAPGKVADLVLLAANPLLDVDNIFRQDGVMLHGRWFSAARLQEELARMARAARPGSTAP